MPIDRSPSVSARRRPARRARGWAVFGAAACLAAAAGCAWSTRSGLPEHIRTVSVPMFGNPTTDYGVETRLTAALRRAVMQDNRVKLVNGDADAELTGQIEGIDRRSVRDDRDDRPATMQLVVQATYSFRDERAGRYLVQNASIDSSQAASARGLYNVDRTPGLNPGDAALDAAIEALAAEIVRRTLGMW